MQSTARLPMDSRVDPVLKLAQRLADAVPPLPDHLRDDAGSCRAWADLMLEAAHGLAAAVAHDSGVLVASLGPAVEVGVTPPWRALLEIAHVISAPNSSIETRIISSSLAHA